VSVGSGVSLGAGVGLAVWEGVALGSGVRVRVLVGVRKGVPRVEVGLGVVEGMRVPVDEGAAGTTLEVDVGVCVAVAGGGVLSAINIVSAQ
jgi:hypothetical protein